VSAKFGNGSERLSLKPSDEATTTTETFDEGKPAKQGQWGPTATDSQRKPPIKPTNTGKEPSRLIGEERMGPPTATMDVDMSSGVEESKVSGVPKPVATVRKKGGDD
jgi:hypothetical protein